MQKKKIEKRLCRDDFCLVSVPVFMQKKDAQWAVDSIHNYLDNGNYANCAGFGDSSITSLSTYDWMLFRKQVLPGTLVCLDLSERDESLRCIEIDIICNKEKELKNNGCVHALRYKGTNAISCWCDVNIVTNAQFCQACLRHYSINYNDICRLTFSIIVPLKSCSSVEKEMNRYFASMSGFIFQSSSNVRILTDDEINKLSVDKMSNVKDTKLCQGM